MSTDSRVSTGIPELDEILYGGYVPNRSVLLRGPPGAGKTIFGLHFLAAGSIENESGLYINLGEPAEYALQTVDAFGLDFSSVEFLDLSPTGKDFQDDQTYELFKAADVEGPPLVDEIRDTVAEIDPERVLLDPITEFRYLTTDDRQFRKQILGFLDFLESQESTVMLTSQAANTVNDDDLQFLADAVITLKDYPERRAIEVSKFRGSTYKRGDHTFDITDQGIVVWPKLFAGDYERDYEVERLSSGVPELDQLLSGGIESGTITYLTGPTGVGKTTTGLQFLKEAAGRGKRSVMFSFEESINTILRRAESVNLPVERMMEQETLHIEEITPGSMTVDEFSQQVREEVENNNTEVVMIDGTSGYKQGLRGFGDNPMDELLQVGRFLRNTGTIGIIINEVHQITGSFQATEEGISNLADNIVFLRHVEHQGQLRKVIGVLKKRTSDYEKWLRELEITEYGIRVGEPLPELRGILTGTPDWDQGTKENPGTK